MLPLRISLLTLLAALVAVAPALHAAEDKDAFRVLPPGQLPNDSRLGPPKELDDYFPFTVSKTKEDWAKRREQVIMQIRVSLGLYPEPTRTSLNAQVYGKMDLGDYTVEKVHFESMPGFFVTGNLYRPKDSAEKHAAVLCPYGHWNNGRFQDENAATIKKAFETGAEKFESAARNPQQARCVQLARMGCVVFHYDMIGKADCTQITDEIAHKFAKQRPEMNSATRWGFYSPQAESHGQSIMGLQTWDSIRALDFISTLPDVDTKRIAVTGASGGATQTLMLAALEDDRLAAAFPAVMVSTAMQGGCTCENACGLRVGTGNVEFAALFAPKPMGMTAANDWTKEMPTKGFPELQKHWAMLGAPDNVMLAPHLEFPHNYNAVSRAAMYRFFNKHLGLNLPEERLVERDFKFLTKAELTVWDEAHPAPKGGDEFEKDLLQVWKNLCDQDGKLRNQISENSPYIRGLRTLTGREMNADEVDFAEVKQEDGDGFTVKRGLVRNKTHHEEVPVVLLQPKTWSGATVIWLSDKGKDELHDANGRLDQQVRHLLDADVRVVGADLFGQGELKASEQETYEQTYAQKMRSKNPREAPAYTYGYNDPLIIRQVHDILTIATLVGNDHEKPAGALAIRAHGNTGLTAALSRFVVPLRGVLFEGTTDLKSSSRSMASLGAVKEFSDPLFLPHAAQLGDHGALFLFSADKPLQVHTWFPSMLVCPPPNPAPTEPEFSRAEQTKWLLEQLRR